MRSQLEKNAVSKRTDFIEQLIRDGRLSNPRAKNSKAGKFYYIDLNAQTLSDKRLTQPDPIDRIKSRVKQLLGRHYILFVHCIAPVMPRISLGPFKPNFKRKLDTLIQQERLILQVGSGNERFNSHIINIDLRDFPEVDVIADCTKLPFASESVDAIINNAVLEHVHEHDTILLEMKRVLKPGGTLLTGVPFIQGFHGSPDDFYRWTKNGMRAFHERFGFNLETIEVSGGPTSGLLWILQEWLSLFFSLGSTRLYYILYPIFLILLSPLKLLDLILVHHPLAHKIASFIVCTSEKK